MALPIFKDQKSGWQKRPTENAQTAIRRCFPPFLILSSPQQYKKCIFRPKVATNHDKFFKDQKRGT